MRLIFALLTVAQCLQLQVVNTTRIDVLTTSDYVFLERLELCVHGQCKVKPCTLVHRTILLDKNDTWDHIRATLTVQRADGTTLKAQHVEDVVLPPAAPIHVWYIIDGIVIVAILIAILVWVEKVPQFAAPYVSKAQKDRQLAQTLEGVYRGPEHVSDYDHDNV